MDQASAHDHAQAQTAGGSAKGTTVCVGTVSRGDAAAEFQNFKCVDAGPAADVPPPEEEEADAADRIRRRFAEYA